MKFNSSALVSQGFIVSVCAVLPSRGHTACNSVALSLDAARRLAQWLHQQASDGGRKKMCLDLLAKLNGLAASDFQSAPLLPAPDFVMPAFELTPPAQPVARNVLFTPPATKRPMHLQPNVLCIVLCIHTGCMKAHAKYCRIEFITARE